MVKTPQDQEKLCIYPGRCENFLRTQICGDFHLAFHKLTCISFLSFLDNFSECFSCFLNPPVTISLSDKPGHFFFQSCFLTQSASDHTTVSQTGFFFIFFFKHIFDHKRQWPYHGLTDQVLKNPVGQTVVWSLGLLNSYGHWGLWNSYGHWGLLNLYGHWWVQISLQLLWNFC